MLRRFALMSLVASVACNNDDPPKDTGEASRCIDYVEAWNACTTAAGEGVDPSLEDPEAYCEENADTDNEHWDCLIGSIYEQYCTNIQGLTFIQGEFNSCYDL
jgi:hypothetical protein